MLTKLSVKKGIKMFKVKAINAIDFYKSGHIFQYPKGTTGVYSNFTPRSDKHMNVERSMYDGKFVFYGLEMLIIYYLIEMFNDTFFNMPAEEVVPAYKNRMDTSLFCDFKVEHIAALHKLGYIPLRIKALPEGVKVNPGIPVFTIRETISSFYWLTNYVESALSSELWKKMLNATIANHYRQIFKTFAIRTGAPLDFVDWQGHDFSMRGMSGIVDAAMTGTAHLTSFYGTDTVTALDAIEYFYNAKGLLGGSVPATEHSVMCLGEEAGERETIKRLITEVYPSGIVSIVSDTWDFWSVIAVTAPSLKEEIMARDGKVVFRPDSGDPVKIICGDPKAPVGSNEWKGAVRILAERFGTTMTEAGYMVLDKHVGLIYGDSITPRRAYQILSNLEDMGYASCNCVFGIGSYTYNYSTRDSLGAAIKSTSGSVNNVRRDIFKNPKTDDGIKKSAKGLLRVELLNGEYVLYDNQTPEEEALGELKIVFEDGKLLRRTPFEDIRARLM